MVPLAAGSQPTGREINPGLLGPNALAPYETSGPWVGDRWLVTFGAAVQLSTPVSGTDFSLSLPFRIEYPFVRRAAIWVEGTPLEAFQYSTETQVAWAPSRAAGVTRGDLTLGTRFVVFPGTKWFPAVAARVMLKTATGENLANRRFLDAPAYQLDLLLGQRFPLAGGLLELALNLGFLAWQQGEAGQNDAFAGSGRLRWDYKQLGVRLEVRGYSGWQQNDLVRVGVVGVDWTVAGPLRVEFSASRSFQDPAGFDFRLGVRLSGPSLPSP